MEGTTFYSFRIEKTISPDTYFSLKRIVGTHWKTLNENASNEFLQCLGETIPVSTKFFQC